MGAFIDLTGQTFGEWYVLARVPKEKHPNSRSIYWLCRCSCGNEVEVLGDSLRAKKSTKCQQCANANKSFHLEGQHFNKLTVIRKAEPNEHNFQNDRSTIWLCKCDCGSDKNIYVRSTDLCSGKVHSCGCYNKEMSFLKNSIDLTNQQFGELIALKPTDKRRNGSVIWDCLCSCGNHNYVTQNDLVSGSVQSCGCTKKSRGERKIIQILTENNIKFEEQKTFPNGRYPNTQQLMRFDFYLPDYNILIEYDGEQHFRPVNGWGGEDRFLQQQQRDNYKNDWCKNHNIKLIRIPYTEYNNITINTFIQEVNN